MKVSLNLAQQLQPKIDYRSISKESWLQILGLQLGAIEDVVDYSERYQKIYVSRVKSCEKHPESDHLKVCLLDDGGAAADVDRDKDGLVQVVCGASNVASGQLVAWLAPGATVPASFDESDKFVLVSRDLRGIKSNGMIGSPKELGLFDDHEGILVINEEEVIDKSLLDPGTEFVKMYGLDDLVFDCENKMFTHRPDCFGNLGVAREMAAITEQTFASPEWYLEPLEIKASAKLVFDVENKIPKKVPRFCAQLVEGVQLAQSPIWRKALLNRVGIRSINNIVDLTNYHMHLTAQPTHAFDFDKLLAVAKEAGSERVLLHPRMARAGEKLKLLGGKEIELNEADMVIACNDRPVALAGIMGGADTEVDASTKNIVIECANFDMYTIRRSSMRHGLFTDAVTRFNKGQSPLQNKAVISKLVADILEECEGAKAGELKDLFEAKPGKKSVSIEVDYVNDRLGTKLDAKTIAGLLGRAEIESQISGDVIEFFVPFWRTDLDIREDIVEEVGRIYGYMKLPVVLPERQMVPTKRNKQLDLKFSLRQKLKELGANETLNYAFVHGNLLKRTGVDPDVWAYHLKNAISPDVQYYRTSVIVSLLDKIHSNLKSGSMRPGENEIALYEIGKAHVKNHVQKDEENIDYRPDRIDLPKEFLRLAFVFAADAKTAQKYNGSGYYQALHYMRSVLGFEADLNELDSNEYPITSMYQMGRAAQVSCQGVVFGVVGEIRSEVREALKLPDFTAGFEIDLDLLSGLSIAKQYQTISLFPKTRQDLTLTVGIDTKYSSLHTELYDFLQAYSQRHEYNFSVELVSIFAADAEHLSYTFRIVLSHNSRTLTTEEVNKLLDEARETVEK